MRLAAGIEYDGSFFCGWQRQASGQSVQACVEEALSKVADHPISIVCAGRTDAGVHALQQVVHFDTLAHRTPRAWVLGTNVNLPPSIRLLWVKPVADAFHARFSAKARAYRYVIFGNGVPSAILHKKVTWVYTALDVGKMQEAAKYLVGTHDFSAFRCAGCQAKQPVKTIYTLQVVSAHFPLLDRSLFEGAGEQILQVPSIPKIITIDIEANGFLHHMVRNVAGVLLTIGRNLRPAVWAREVLDTKDRKKAGPTAPADGLYFVGVRYGAKFALPTL